MSIKTVIDKINATPAPKVKKVALAYSGGLDSSLAVALLRRVYKAKEIVPITVDIGQGEEEIIEGNKKAKLLNIEPIMVDMKKEFTQNWLTRAIYANSDYLGYPVSTSMTRQIIAR
ncbi:MAG TPA: argininosuccinate synthase, partial [Thermodesulfobacteriota bacterium]|nr:argininosuccinate synthase [Thermodesulfobacteriota bacterium]